MREEYELEVLEKYDLEVRGTRRIRGAFFCDTNEGVMLLRETKLSGQRALFLYHVLSRLEMGSNLRVDTPVFTAEGEILAGRSDGSMYMLKKWYGGRECDVRQEAEAVRAAEQLARLHNGLNEEQIRDLQGIYGESAGTAQDPLEEIRRHNRELKKVRRFIRKRPVKNAFEYLFLESFDRMYGLAERVEEQMADSGCAALYRRGIREGRLFHGAYNYHNILMMEDGIAVTDFDRMKVGIQVYDLYYFLRKVMEKYSWKQKTGQKLLEAYESVRPLSPDEREYIGLMLAYPEKYWKTAGNYYRSNKAWMPEKNREKLQLVLRQCGEKQAFLEQMFSVVI